MPRSLTSHTATLIIGAGLAGLAAAHHLRESGRRAVVLEASHRIGGRAFGGHWEDAGRVVDFGGTWLLPGFSHTRTLLTKLGITTFMSPAAPRSLAHFSDGVHSTFRASNGVSDELHRVAEAIERMVPQGGTHRTAADALAAIPMSSRARDWHVATQRYLAGAPLDRIDASHLLIPHSDLVDPDHYREQITGSTEALVTALAHQSQAEIHLRQPVTHVRTRSSDDFDIVTARGHAWRADSIVVALPRNTLQVVNFDIDLPPSMRHFAQHPHPGASRKEWLILEGVVEHFRVFASRGPFGYFRSEERLPDGAMLAVGLAPAHEPALPLDQLQERIRAYLPSVTIRSRTSHSWVGDPWTRGTWFVPAPGDSARIESSADGCLGNVQFAGADFSMTHPGTLEGAIRSGISAAERILTIHRP